MDRTQIVLWDNWKFSEACGPGEVWGREVEEAWYKGFDDSAFRPVCLPHDWAVEQPFSQACSSGTGYLPGGTAWYRAHFFLPEEYRGKQIRVVFDGVYKNSQVWCNSYYLGKRPSGYSTFSYDITHAAAFGDCGNVLAVKVSHPDIADSRWYTGSGITRKVTLLIQEPVHPCEYGVVFRASKIRPSRDGREGSASVTVRHSVEGPLSPEGQEGRVQIVTRFVDGEGKVCLTLEGEGRPGETTVLAAQWEKAFLWAPDHPFLYTMRTWYTPEGGEPYLADEQQVGLREALFDPDRGFFLNGIETKLKGVCVHHDGGALGAAMEAPVWQRRLERLKECGCNAIRCSHNPHMPELYALCDRMGFLVMDEAFDEWENAKNKWVTGHNVYPPGHQGYYEEFPQWGEEDLAAMIRRDRNHPSVILWSIGNEIDYPNDPYCHPLFEHMTGNNDAGKPAAEQRYDPDRPNAARLVCLAGRLEQVARREDDSRPVTLACAYPELSAGTGLLDGLDVIGYNYKEHLYEADHARFPGKPLLGSENGHSYGAWLAVRDNPYISGQFLWTGIDYLGEAKGWPIRGSMAGILTCAGEPKPEFDRRRSFWQDAPVLALATRRVSDGPEDWRPMQRHWNYEPGEEILVKVYSNLPKVELFLDHALVGTLESYNGDGAYCFTLPFRPGTLTARAAGPGKETLTDSLSTVLEAAGFTYSVWQQPDLLGEKSWEEASGEPGYLYQVQVGLKDPAGRPVTWKEEEIAVVVEGPGRRMGLESGDLSDVTPYSAKGRRTYQGRLWVYVRRLGKGPIALRLSMREGEIAGTILL